MSGAVTAPGLSSEDLIHDTAHCPCVLYLSSINCQGTVGRTVIRDGVDADCLVTAVTIIPHSTYLPGDTNIGASSMTGEVCSFTHGDSLVLNILYYIEWFCKERRKIGIYPTSQKFLSYAQTALVFAWDKTRL